MVNVNEVQDKIQNIQILNSLISRAELAGKLGMSYGGERDLYQSLGYKTNLTYEDYATAYARQDIAKAVINRPIETTWKGEVNIVETDDTETPFEKAYQEIDDRIKLKSKFVRLDKLSCLGEYGVLFLGFDDAKTERDLQNPVQPGPGRKLLYVKPLGKNHAKINTWERDTNNPRFGMPYQYQLSISQPGGTGSKDLHVHHSRIIHVIPELLESECEGEPVLKVVYNRLQDLEKLLGGSGEMFWRGGRPGYHGKLDPDVQITAEQEDELMEQLNEYEHNLRRVLMTQGVDLQSLSTQVADPSNHVNVQIQMISAATGIPQRILTGSERGELASSGDRNNWFDMITSRRQEYAEQQIILPFVDRLITFGVLPEPAEPYKVEWEDLYSASDQQKAEVGKTRATALKEYANAPSAMDLVPLESFLKHFIGLGDEEIEIINQARENMISEEQSDFNQGDEGNEEEE